MLGVLLLQEIEELRTQLTNTFDADVDDIPVQDMAQNKKNIFQADECDTFDFDVDEAPTTQTMFIDNLYSADLVYDEACRSYDLDILSDVQNHDNCLDDRNKYHEEHEMQHDVQPNNVVYLDTEYTSNGNVILYEHGQEIVKPNHARVLVHNSEDTLEIAETTRKQINEKMKDLECVKKKVKIEPHDYSKENYLVTFTP
nr:retrovirus-related Pol polyprotein from transposon TNT 1-94 [Tanacetum cinerariifolium]